jgi:hypothetical protein
MHNNTMAIKDYPCTQVDIIVTYSFTVYLFINLFNYLLIYLFIFLHVSAPNGPLLLKPTKLPKEYSKDLHELLQTFIYFNYTGLHPQQYKVCRYIHVKPQVTSSVYLVCFA